MHSFPATLSALFLALFTAAGCTTSSKEGCPELCERTSHCPDTAKTKDQCQTSCENTGNIADKASCGSQWGAYLECFSHATNACEQKTVEDECSVQLGLYTACMKSYCEKNPTDCSSFSP